MDKVIFDKLWDAGYRCYEVYLYNTSEVFYCGEIKAAGTVSGWDIKHIFAHRDSIVSYPFFDTIVCISDMSVCTDFHLGF